jgi:gpW
MDENSLQCRLNEAETALHRLQIGQAFVKVTLPDGSSTEFKAANINELRGYILDLRDQLAGIGRRKHGAINVIF